MGASALAAERVGGRLRAPLDALVARPMDNPLSKPSWAGSGTAWRRGSSLSPGGQAYPPGVCAKEIVAILIDQNVQRKEAVFVDFFGSRLQRRPRLASFSLRAQLPFDPGLLPPGACSSYLVRSDRPSR